MPKIADYALKPPKGTEAKIRAEWVPGNENDRSILGFRIRNGGARGPMSKSQYKSLQKSGRGPREIRALNTIIITPEEEAEWRRERTEPKGAEARLRAREDRARKQRARNAGRKGVKARGLQLK